MKRFRIYTGTGRYPDGTNVASHEEAKRVIRRAFDWSRIYEQEHCAGGAWSCYPSAKDRQKDSDGAHAITITLVRSCQRCGCWLLADPDDCPYCDT